MARFRLPMPSPSRSPSGGRRSGRGGGRQMFGGSGLKMRLLIALAIAAFALLSYYGNPGDRNEITGQVERVAMADEQQEMALGAQAEPAMIQQHGGVSPMPGDRQAVQDMGKLLLRGLDNYIAKLQQATDQDLENPYQFKFTLLKDSNTINAFALPGGRVFITQALFDQLQTPGQLAGVLGHEIGHVIERHGNKRMAKQKMFSILAAAGGVAGGDQNSARMSQAAMQMISMKYGREDELESDRWGVRLCVEAGYNPEAMYGLMRILDEASQGGPPEMMSTHPKPANRIAYIRQVIEAEFPNGLPPGLKE